MTGKILIVDDDRKHARKIQAILQGEGHSVPAITEAAKALAQAESSEPDVIVVDMGKAPAKAFELSGRLRIKERTRRIPVLYLISAKSASSSGPIPASDLVVHDTDIVEMKSAVRHLLIESAQSNVYESIMKEARGSLPPSSDLTGSDASVLSDGGFPSAREAAPAPIARRLAAYALILDGSLTTSQAAERLGVNPSRVRQRLTARPPTLYGIRNGSEWMLPAFQFDRDRLIPNFDRLIAGIDPQIDPVALYQWFLAPHVDLVRDDERISPRQWLLSGLPWKRPAELAADL